MPEKMTMEQTAELAEEKLETESSILIITNTTAQARAIYESITAPCRKIYLSKSKCRAHRIRLINEIKAMTTALTQSDTGKKLVVVSTQLVEAGVDISFSCGIRLTAGVDNIIQAAGRVNRSGEFGRICDLYVVNAAEENLSKLPDIRLSKECTENILAYEPGRNIADERTIREYYDEYFRVERNTLDSMDFICGKTTIMEMLSLNNAFVEKYLDKERPLPVLRQAFATAGREYKAIDSYAVSVIVPFGKGREYIERLAGAGDLREKYRLLKTASEYTVSLYEWQIQRLKDNNGILYLDDIGVYCLAEDFYDEELGAVTEADVDRAGLIF